MTENFRLPEGVTERLAKLHAETETAEVDVKLLALVLVVGFTALLFA